MLPAKLDRVVLRDLRVREASVDVVIDNYGHDVGVHIDRRQGDLEVVVIKRRAPQGNGSPFRSDTG